MHLIEYKILFTRDILLFYEYSIEMKLYKIIYIKVILQLIFLICNK